MHRIVIFGLCCVIGVWFNCISERAFCQSVSIDGRKQQLNLRFEKVDEYGLPSGFEIHQKNDEYFFSMDSLDKVEGKYSLKIESVEGKDGYPRDIATANYWLSGDSLGNKEIEVSAYIQPQLTGTAFAALEHSCNLHNRISSSHDVYLKGTLPWRKYRYIFYTDSTTNKISFGVTLVGKGSLHVDYFEIYINDKLLDTSLMRRYGLKCGPSVKVPRRILLHHTSSIRQITGTLSKKGNDQRRKLSTINAHHTARSIEDKEFYTYKFKNPKYIEPLNLGFERLGKNKFPTRIKWQEEGGKYNVVIDSLDKIEGKYSLKIQSVNVPNTGQMSFVDILYQLRGDYLKNKEIMVCAFLKLENVNPAFSSAGLWYNTSPPPFSGESANTLFYGNMKLKGTSDWKRYKLIFYTDSATQSITFGALLNGSGSLNIDHFEIYINGHLLNPLLTNRNLQNP